MVMLNSCFIIYVKAVACDDSDSWKEIFFLFLKTCLWIPASDIYILKGFPQMPSHGNLLSIKARSDEPLNYSRSLQWCNDNVRHRHLHEAVSSQTSRKNTAISAEYPSFQSQCLILESLLSFWWNFLGGAWHSYKQFSQHEGLSPLVELLESSLHHWRIPRWT